MVDDKMIDVARRFADGLARAGRVRLRAQRLHRRLAPRRRRPPSTPRPSWPAAWDASVDDPALAARWAALGDLPEGTLGRRVWELYRARGFAFPGRPGSAPPLLAQHDWVHVLADYGTTVECELEVFAFIARANDDMRAFSLLAMVCRCSRPATCAPAPGCSNPTSVTSRPAPGWPSASATPCGAARSAATPIAASDEHRLPDASTGSSWPRSRSRRSAPGSACDRSPTGGHRRRVDRTRGNRAASAPSSWRRARAWPSAKDGPYDSYGASVA